MNTTTRIAILGYGNIGRAIEQAVAQAGDMTLTGIYHHNEINSIQAEDTDVVLLGVPSREVPQNIEQLFAKGLNTVDSFDIHNRIPAVRQQIKDLAKKAHTVSVLSAGWDPGSDSVVRCLMQAMMPQGLTYTDFGPGRSMGHTVAARSIKGVKDALSMTIPLGTGIHRRMVYVELEQGADFETVKEAILADDYFVHDETHVIQVPDVQALNNVAHGVHLVRNGVSGSTHNQRMELNMTINNPALTGQIMVSCARAAKRMADCQQWGCYTMIELPPVSLLEGEADYWIQQLV